MILEKKKKRYILRLLEFCVFFAFHIIYDSNWLFKNVLQKQLTFWSKYLTTEIEF